jgi:hypothetical protein
MGLDMPGFQERIPQGEFTDATVGFWRGCRILSPHQCHDAVPGGDVLPIWFICWMRDIPALHGRIMSIDPSIIWALPLMPIAVFLNG